jgi:hypothetical protein
MCTEFSNTCVSLGPVEVRKKGNKCWQSGTLKDQWDTSEIEPLINVSFVSNSGKTLKTSVAELDER